TRGGPETSRRAGRQRRERTAEMATETEQPSPAPPRSRDAPQWCVMSPEDVASKLGADPARGLSAGKAAGLLRTKGPNALPAEPPVPGWKRFVSQYKSYMQIILVVAAGVSLAIKEFSTGVLLVVITLLNAVLGLRQEGKAESAMNALKSMMKATARVRRHGV